MTGIPRPDWLKLHLVSNYYHGLAEIQVWCQLEDRIYMLLPWFRINHVTFTLCHANRDLTASPDSRDVKERLNSAFFGLCKSWVGFQNLWHTLTSKRACSDPTVLVRIIWYILKALLSYKLEHLSDTAWLPFSSTDSDKRTFIMIGKSMSKKDPKISIFPFLNVQPHSRPDCAF